MTYAIPSSMPSAMPSDRPVIRKPTWKPSLSPSLPFVPSATNTFVVTVAGSGRNGQASQPVIGTYAAFKSPYGLAFDQSKQYMFIVDMSSQQVNRMDLSSRVVEPIHVTGKEHCFEMLPFCFFVYQ